MDVSNASCEPMDIDQSFGSVKSRDNSFVEETLPKAERRATFQIKTEPIEDEENSECCKETLKPPEWNVKKFHIKLERSKKQSVFRVRFVVMSTIAVCLSLLVYVGMNVQCIDNLQVDKIGNELSNKLFGQQTAVERIIEALNTPAQSKLIFFYGGTGVGKTFAASLILSDVWKYSNIYHFTMPSFKETFSSKLMLGLSLCKSTVIVVDNLSLDNMDISSQIKEIIEKSEYSPRNITIILIYNCEMVSKGFRKSCDKFFAEDLKDTFTEIKAFKKFIKFTPLSEDNLRKCIETEMGDQHMSEYKMQNFLRNFDVASDGCKGVHMKMKFLSVL